MLLSLFSEILTNMQVMLNQWHGLPRLIIAGLALYRLAQLIVYDDGPWDFIQNIRAWLGVYDYNQNGKPKTMIGKLFACPYCVGVWLTLPTFLAVFYPILIIDIIFILGGLAGGQAFLQSLARDD